MHELRDSDILKGLLSRIREKTRTLPSPLNIMEVCGTHTMTVHRSGLRSLLEEAGIRMLSGPGCPVCITPNAVHEAAIGLVTEKENLILATFGDMTRVPTSKGSLQTAVPAVNSRVAIVYSPEESLEAARRNSEKDVVFFGVGFETTIPSIALTAVRAHREKLENYSVLSALWLIPPPLRAILTARDTEIHGFLYPGHVSAVIGESPYRFIPEEFGIPGCIAGFEPGDILLGILSILDQIREGRPRVANTYARVVRKNGNPKARAFMEEACETKDAVWRGLGLIPESGLKFRAVYSPWDAEVKYGLEVSEGGEELPGCRCGDVLKGKLSPTQCPLFGRKCRPESPQGPCMVSFEGACLARFKYGDGRGE